MMSDNITIEEVRRRLEYGEYEAIKVDKIPGRTQSQAWTTFRKICDASSRKEIKNGNFGFYYCTDCKEIVNKDISNGTGVLLGHQKTDSRQNADKL